MTSMSVETEIKPDWLLEQYDPETTESQDIETEIRRLQVLKSYHILDQPQQPGFDRITGLAARIFKVPIAVISLVDLGRQWYASSVGLQEKRGEEPRRTAICAHTILHIEKVMVVPDLSTDFRFQNSPALEEGIRFYAGASLISAEGFKLGTICLMDTEARPLGLTEDEKKSLADLADVVMDLMEEHRNSLQAGRNHSGLRYSLDVQRSVSFLRGQLSKLKNDTELQSIIGEEQKHLLQSASETCQFLYTSLVPSRTEDGMSNPKKDNPNTPPNKLLFRHVGITTTIELNKFVKSLEFVMESFPKDVHLIFSVDSKLPEHLVFNDLKVFRSAIALLTSACERTKKGHVHFRMFGGAPGQDNKQVVFECEDTGPDIDLDHYAQLFLPPDDSIEDFVCAQDCIRVDKGTGAVSHCESSFGCQNPVGNGFGVHAVAQYIGSLGGDYGFRPRIGDRGNRDGQTGSVFWFSIPLRTRPPSDSMANEQEYAKARAVPGTLPSFYKFENIAQPNWR